MHRQVVRRERLLVERVCRLKLVGKVFVFQIHFVCGAQGVQRVSELPRSIDGEALERRVAELEHFILIKRIAFGVQNFDLLLEPIIPKPLHTLVLPRHHLVPVEQVEVPCPFQHHGFVENHLLHKFRFFLQSFRFLQQGTRLAQRPVLLRDRIEVHAAWLVLLAAVELVQHPEHLALRHLDLVLLDVHLGQIHALDDHFMRGREVVVAPDFDEELRDQHEVVQRILSAERIGGGVELCVESLEVDARVPRASGVVAPVTVTHARILGFEARRLGLLCHARHLAAHRADHRRSLRAVDLGRVEAHNLAHVLRVALRELLHPRVRRVLAQPHEHVQPRKELRHRLVRQLCAWVVVAERFAEQLDAHAEVMGNAFFVVDNLAQVATAQV
mmetsp:Transcript_98226/g.147286  ORF Transcript_98226/g.147286 Transcript_98226/m.147286 type:complete len:386 (-) Transcript_98226:1165-2322(-)